MALAPAVEVRGLDELSVFLQAAPKEVSKGMDIALRKSAQVVEKFWKLRLSGPAGPRRLGVGTGALRRSIQTGKVQNNSVRIGTDKAYASPHEFGFFGRVNVRAHTRRGVAVRAHSRIMRMTRRPAREPALRDARPIVDQIMAGQVDAALERSRVASNRLKFQQRAQLADIRRLGGTGRRTR